MLPTGVESAAEALGAKALEKNGEYRIERRGRRIYLIPRRLGRELVVELAIQLEPHGAGAAPENVLVAPPQLELTRARGGGAALKDMPELRTGDPELDAHVALDLPHLEDEGCVRKILEPPAVRAAVLELTAKGAKVRIDPGPKAWLTARFEDPSKLELSSELEALANRLAELADALPAFELSVRPMSPAWGCATLAIGLAFAGVLAANLTEPGFVSLSGELEIVALVSAVVLLGPLLLLTWRRFKGPRSKTAFAVLAAASLIAFPLTFLWMARLINAVGDPSVQARTATVIDKGIVDNSRGEDVYWIEVSSWKTDSEPVRVRLDKDEHGPIVKGETVDVHVGRGRLGYEWVRRVTRR